MLLAIDLMVRHTGKHFIDEEGVAVASMLPFQSSGIQSTELDAPEPNGLAADYNAPFGQ
jgi:hypothetical protein